MPQCSLPALGICRNVISPVSLFFKTKKNFPTLTCSKKKKAAYSIHSCLLLPFSLWHADRGKSDDMNETAWELIRSHGNPTTLRAGSSSYFAVRFVLCDFERGLRMISKGATRWGKPPREGVTQRSRRRESQRRLAVLELDRHLYAVFEVSKTET